MSIAQAVLEKLQALPLEKQQEILDFAEFLYQKVRRTGETPLSSQADPIWGLGSEPISLGLSDAAENHDTYLYGSD
jgi:hypothetical protein